MENILKLIESKYMKKDVPQFNVGDTVDVQLKIVEEGKSRIQTFEGIVIARAGSGLRESFTVRKISYGEGVEMVFPLHSPFIDRIKVMKKGDVKRAKLYYLKRKIGKETRVDEKIEHAAGHAARPAAAPAQEAAAPREEAT